MSCIRTYTFFFFFFFLAIIYLSMDLLKFSTTNQVHEFLEKKKKKGLKGMNVVYQAVSLDKPIVMLYMRR